MNINYILSGQATTCKPTCPVREQLLAAATPDLNVAHQLQSCCDNLTNICIHLEVLKCVLMLSTVRVSWFFSLLQDVPGPLHGIIIAVSKKLSSQQGHFNHIAASLGADYRWTYDRSCTHFIFQGRQNDGNREFRLARDQGKLIVCPHWLHMVGIGRVSMDIQGLHFHDRLSVFYPSVPVMHVLLEIPCPSLFQCEEQKARVDESLFPHTYNPNMSLVSTPGVKIFSFFFSSKCYSTSSQEIPFPVLMTWNMLLFLILRQLLGGNVRLF